MYSISSPEELSSLPLPYLPLTLYDSSPAVSLSDQDIADPVSDLTYLEFSESLEDLSLLPCLLFLDLDFLANFLFPQAKTLSSSSSSEMVQLWDSSEELPLHLLAVLPSEEGLEV